MGKIRLVGDVSTKEYQILEAVANELKIRNVPDGVDILKADNTTITDAGGVKLNAHASRHQAGGADEVNLQGMKATGSPAKIHLVDTGAGGAERRIASVGGHVKVLDSADAVIMDVEAHASRHAYGGADALGAGAIDRSQIKPQGYLWVKTASPTPGTGGAYGTAVALTPATNKSIVPLSASLTWGGTFGAGETVTIRLTAKFSDGTSASITKSATATGPVLLNPADLQGLMKDAVYITEIDVDSSSSAASTTVTTSATIYGLEI